MKEFNLANMVEPVIRLMIASGLWRNDHMTITNVTSVEALDQLGVTDPTDIIRFFNVISDDERREVMFVQSHGKRSSD